MNLSRSRFSFVLLLLWTLSAKSASPATDLTAIGAPGTSLGHPDVIQLFYTGRALCTHNATCLEYPGLHAPGSWKLETYPSDIETTVPFHVDSQIAAGKDDALGTGLENFNFVFFVGHGTPTGWSPSADPPVEVSPNQFSLGDLLTRYFWMMSCNVLAHGPVGPKYYAQPQSYKNDCVASGSKCADVFATWGTKSASTGKHPLNSRMRMICGGSTTISARFESITPIWHRKYLEGTSVANSYLMGSFDGDPENPQIPLCISLAERPSYSPLVTDEDFTGEKNAAAALDPSLLRLYAAYPQALSPTSPTWRNSPPTAGWTPAFAGLRSHLFLAPAAETGKDEFGFRKISFDKQGLFDSFLVGGSLTMRQSVDSGAIVISGDDPEVASWLAELDNEKVNGIVSSFARALPDRQELSALFASTRIRTFRKTLIRLDSESLPAIQNGKRKALESFEAAASCLFLEADFELAEKDQDPVPLSSLSSRVTLWTCPSRGMVKSENIPWRGTDRWGMSLRIPFLSQDPLPSQYRSYDKALDIARRRLLRSVGEFELPKYHLDGWRLMYDLGPFHCRQEIALLQYVFRFKSSDDPPKTTTFEVLANDLGNQTIEDLLRCSAPPS